MGLLNPKPKLEPDEVLRWKKLANHVEGPGYSLYGMTSAAGGQLVVTDRRILFQPGRADRAVGSKRWECPLAGVVELEKVGRDGEPFAGGMRERLGIRTGEGTEVFVVNKLDRTMNELRGLLALG